MGQYCPEDLGGPLTLACSQLIRPFGDGILGREFARQDQRRRGGEHPEGAAASDGHGFSLIPSGSKRMAPTAPPANPAENTPAGNAFPRTLFCTLKTRGLLAGRRRRRKCISRQPACGR